MDVLDLLLSRWSGRIGETATIEGSMSSPQDPSVTRVNIKGKIFEIIRLCEYETVIRSIRDKYLIRRKGSVVLFEESYRLALVFGASVTAFVMTKPPKE